LTAAADLLEERGDAAAAYARLQAQNAQAASSSAEVDHWLAVWMTLERRRTAGRAPRRTA
jgi:hypothetical protein